jgi:hypothetical protein
MPITPDNEVSTYQPSMKRKNQRSTTENENRGKSSILILWLGE